MRRAGICSGPATAATNFSLVERTVVGPGNAPSEMLDEIEPSVCQD
jgi:hypothetical protein